jgi:Protein of unknown function (DUF1302)
MTTSRQQHVPHAIALALGAFACGCVMAQGAGRPSQGGARQETSAPFRISGGVSYGIGVRTSEPDAFLLMRNNAATIGVTSTNALGRNQDDGNLNYGKGDVFTNVVTGFADFNLSQGPISAQVRVLGWHDFELKDGEVPFGHVPNGYQPNQPLSDASARPRGRFSNVVVSTAVVRARTSVADMPLTITAGNQNIGWRGFGIAPGPMAVLDPADVPAIIRPGGFPESRLIPFLALRGGLKVSNTVDVDAYYQLSHELSQNPLCGTFFARTDVYGQDGCELQMNAGQGATRTDQQMLAQNITTAYARSEKPASGGQYGISTRWKPNPDAELALSYARYHSRGGYIAWTKSLITTVPVWIPGDPRNAGAFSEYPRGIHVLALEGRHDFKPVVVYGSVGYSPNRPLGYPGAEMSQTFTSPPTVSTIFRARERALAPGEVFHGWDRLKMSDWNLGATHEVQGLLGAASIALQGEINARIIHDLPDPNVLRYQRPDVFGMGPVNGVCGNPAMCTTDGYVSKTAVAYTLQAAATYPNLIGSVTVRPRLGVSHSVKGYSADHLVKEGRVRLALGADVVYGRTTATLSLVRDVKRSDFDNLRDRSFVSLGVSTRF